MRWRLVTFVPSSFFYNAARLSVDLLTFKLIVTPR